MFSMSQPVNFAQRVLDEDQDQDQEPKRRLFGFMTPSALQKPAGDDDEKDDAEIEDEEQPRRRANAPSVNNKAPHQQQKKSPITKLEIDKSKRKLTFADCEPGEEIDAVLAENAEKEKQK